MQQPYAARTHDKMREVLMNPDAPGPDIHYYMIRGGSDKKNVTVWESGTIGGEYVKTYGHYHVREFNESYEIVAGTGVLLLQTRGKDPSGRDIDDEIVSFQAIKVKAGDIVPIPPFSGHLLANTGPSWLVTIDDSPVDLAKEPSSAPSHAEYDVIHKMRGFAYYVVEQNGQPALVKNPHYKSVPNARIVEYVRHK